MRCRSNINDALSARTIPADPSNGAPLRYRVLKEGVVVSSVGDALTDEAGKDRVLQQQDHLEFFENRGFRLWNPDRRRQRPKGGE
jgi:hypothetical protein